MDYYKEIECLLKKLPQMKQAAKNLTARHKSLGEIKPSSAKGRKAYDIALEIADIERQLTYTQSVITQVENTLCQLEAEEQQVLSAWYIDHLPKEKILEQMHIESLSSLYELRNRAVTDFTLLYFGVTFR